LQVKESIRHETLVSKYVVSLADDDRHEVGAVTATEVIIAVEKCVDPHSPLPWQIPLTFKGMTTDFAVSFHSKFSAE
jgi:hypothetical protein